MEIYIYGLRDPRTDKIRYVGKTHRTLEERLYGHLRDITLNVKTHKVNWLKNLAKDNLVPIIEIIEECSQDNWAEREKYWIQVLPNLTNQCTGGKGGASYGRIYSESTRKKISEGWNNNREERSKKISLKAKGLQKPQWRKDQIKEYVIKNQGKPVLQYTLDGQFIQRWRCTSEAADFYEVDRSSVMRAARGKFKKSAGYKWKFEDIVHTDTEKVG